MNKKLSLPESTAAIWQQIHTHLRAFIRKRVSHDADTEDILQNVFIRVHRNLQHLKNRDRLLAWIHQITRRAIVDYYRSSGRRREVPAGLTTDLEAHHPHPTSVITSDGTTELSGCLRPMINQLTREYGEAIRLVELEGMTHLQAADKLGLSVPAMKSRVQRGRRQLRKMLNECCLITLDRRGGITEYRRRRPDHSC